MSSLAGLRKNLGFTQVELADRMGVAQVSVSRIERTDNPSVGSVRRYVEGLGGRLEIRAVIDGEVTVINLPR